MGIDITIKLAKGIKLESKDFNKTILDRIEENDFRINEIDFVPIGGRGSYWVAGREIATICNEVWGVINTDKIPSSEDLKPLIEDALRFGIDEKEIKLYLFKQYS